MESSYFMEKYESGSFINQDVSPCSFFPPVSTSSPPLTCVESSSLIEHDDVIIINPSSNSDRCLDLDKEGAPEDVKYSEGDHSDSGTPLLVRDFKDYDSDSSLSSETSPGSRKFIEPDVGSINKLLNFDNDDDSCDDLLDDSCDDLIDEKNSSQSQQAFENTTNLMSEEKVADVIYHPNTSQMHSSLKEELNSSWSQVSSSLAMANLSLEEVGHIRSVHARADIESLPEDGTTKRDVLEGKICFQCVKTKFGLFIRSKKCPLCSQAVCSKCVAKISATPSLLLPLSSTVATSSTLPRHRSSTTSATSIYSRTGSLRRSSVSMASDKGSILSVCLDCREMVVDIIRSAETARKVDAARSRMMASLEERGGVSDLE